MENQTENEIFKVTVVKTVGGEYYIGHSMERVDETITLKDPRLLTMQMTPQGQPAVMAISPYYFLKNQKLDRISIPENGVIYPFMTENDIDEKLISGYKTEITGIQVPVKPDIII